MLKICCVLLCALLVILFVPSVALAQETQWVRITDDNVCLFANPDGKKVLFLLPKTYYLPVVEETENMFRVTVMDNKDDFPQICGYVYKTDVEICDKQPVAPLYPTEKLTVSANSAQLKLSPTPNAETVITVTNTQKVSYYGQITSYGQDWFYVYFCGNFGYVTASNVTQPVFSPHPTPLAKPVVAPLPTEEPDKTPQEENETPQKSGYFTEILLLVFVLLLSVGICLAVFLPGNVKKKQDVFDKDI